MSDRDHSDHISKLSDSDLESLYHSLTSMRGMAETMDKGIKIDESVSVDGPFGTTIQVTGGNIRWIPDLSPVEKALHSVHCEMLERELLRE